MQCKEKRKGTSKTCYHRPSYHIKIATEHSVTLKYTYLTFHMVKTSIPQEKTTGFKPA